MSDFTDLVKKITAIELDEDTSTVNSADPYKPVEEAVAGTRQTANILKAFSAIEGDSVNEEADLDEEYPSPLDEPKAVAAREKMKKTLKGIKKDKPKHPATVNVREGKTTEDIVGDLRTRFADFLKAEVQQGNDLTTISAAVHEGTASAQAINRSFDSMFSIMEKLLKMTREGGMLYNKVEQEGGDASWIADANEKLSAAYSALEEAHMYALPMDARED